MACRRQGRRLCVIGSVFAATLALLGVQAASAATTWTVQSTPNQDTTTGLIQGMSCATSAFCVAVGDYDNSAGVWSPLAQAWNGHSWHLLNAANPNQASSGQVADFIGVSCLTGGFCMAVGGTNDYGPGDNTGFAESLTGTTWRLEPFAAPAGALGWELRAVSCVRRTFCEAVGSYSTTSQQSRSLAERWNGSKWTVQASPSQAGQYAETELTSVSCVSAWFCLASDTSGPLIERWNGTKWTATTIRNGTDFPAISCTSAKFCVAVGWSGTSLISEQWNGTGWKRATIKQHAGGSQELSALSCRSAAFCEAVGYDRVTGTGAYFAAEWNGKTWRTRDVRGPAVFYQGNSLNAVSCTSARYCLAGGASSDPVQTVKFNGTSWSGVPVLLLESPVSNDLNGVSCVSPTFCEAVGVSSGDPSALPEVWNGSAWKLQADGTLRAMFYSVSCVSSTFCEAVGDGGARWNGTAWIDQGMPADDYQSVSCSSATFCVAVGPVDAAEWNGTSWTAITLPDANSASYVSVSCASAKFCEAVGPGDTGLGGPGVAARWDGTAWTTQSVPGPSGSTRVQLDAVSCATSMSCEVTGYTGSESFTDGWDGTSWQNQGLLPVPSGSVKLLPLGLSCPTAASCTLAGSSLPSSGSGQPAVEAWDGTAWTIQSAAGPDGSGLRAISCLASGYCEAVGSQPAGQLYRTFAESGS